MGYTFLCSKPFSFLVSTLTIFRFPFLSLGIMDIAGSSKLENLLQRLDSAERRAKLLNTEVKSIRKEIVILKNTLNCDLPIGNNFTVNNFSTKNRNIVTTCSSDDETDCPVDTKRFKSSFEEDDGYVTVFTDGACENNGKSNAKAGIGVWFGDNHQLNISKPVEGRATNNTAEIQACIEGLKVLEQQGVKKVKIFTDSQFTINCMTKWIKNWKKNNWKTASGGDVKNKEDLKILDTVIKSFLDVKWQHVAGHQGIKGNEAADELARQGAARYKS
ncbi:ribonuclease H1 isoform X1 [Diorhabda sublineata]|uniref:ribonuclease H1 isoform X1 n=1 Tax=Diorhabda sublineata TaxID=1163346 RepID=UPI0024E13225|nr:ribonuclease H1 isoform X1 [Diorhabda sublineata]